MAKTHFEQAVEDKQRQLADSLLSVPASDTDKIAKTQGQYLGLNTALELYRQAAKRDLNDPDGED